LPKHEVSGCKGIKKIKNQNFYQKSAQGSRIKKMGNE
jgi:hypothetical protein